MTITRLPDHLRDAIPSGLANYLARGIEKGNAVAVLTYQRTDNGEHQYLVEFKNTENAKTLASYCGQSDQADRKQRVPLFPYLPDRPRKLERDTYAGDQVFALEHSPPEDGEEHGFRVEFTLPGHRSRVWRWKPERRKVKPFSCSEPSLIALGAGAGRIMRSRKCGGLSGDPDDDSSAGTHQKPCRQQGDRSTI